MEAIYDINIDLIISHLLSEDPDFSKKISEFEIRVLCSKAQEIFKSQPMLLELKSPIKVCGE